ncbi:hypothetical protein [Clostridium saccharoperbutylacetonicum]|uniref:hypothetical protein n=1 Tax=Clostridium saccharoperbutylacetonicum TaxID=36745 RepID=UPI0039EC8538
MKKYLKMNDNTLRKLYEINWREQLILVGCLLFLWPVGLYQMWKNRHWNIIVKSIITGFYIILGVRFVLFG